MIILRTLKTITTALVCSSSVLFINGCALSNSAGSTSDSAGSLANSSESISDSSKSSSNSSAGDEKSNKYSQYEHETQDFTETYVSTNSALDQQSFMKGLGEVAAQYGIIDWEANPKTYHAIGKGLKMVNVSASRFEVYSRDFTHGDKAKMAQLQQGYQN